MVTANPQPTRKAHTMVTRAELEKREAKWLASYAMKNADSRGRRFAEPQATYRSDFQRDRDRIVHATAFRRLEYKTQVFVNHEGDHYRTRLTHTLEATQIARTIARALQLNEDLTEAVILAHDLGHTPFGHAGERVVDDLMREHGGFEHNVQSLRVVDMLECRYPNFRGLNLTYEVREGIAKHSTPYDNPDLNREFGESSPLLEAQIADLADEIAYHNHDIDDGLSSQMLTWEALIDEVPLFREAYDVVRAQYSDLHRDEYKSVIISTMITNLVDDLINNTIAQLKRYNIDSTDKVRAHPKRLVCFSDEMMDKKAVLRDFLMTNLYHHWRVVRMEEKAKRILRDLFNAYMERNEQIPKEFRDKADPELTLPRIICDYLAGMTDRFALDEHKRFFDPHERV